MGIREYCCFLLFIFFTVTLEGQQGKNPFDLETGRDSLQETSTYPRSNPFDLIQNDEGSLSKSNPFDIQKRPEKNADRLEQMGPVSKKLSKKDHGKGNFNFVLYTGILILFTFLFTIYRSLLTQIYRAFINDNILKLLHRDQISTVKAPYIIWYIFFFVSLSAFLVKVMESFGSTVSGNLWSTFGLILLSVAGVFLIKHVVLILIGWIFPLSKEMGIYSFTIILFSIILGLSLLPINLLAAFGPESMQSAFIVMGLALILLVYGYRSLRAIILTSSKWGQNIFHFFIYLCTIEIAPVIVLFKLITSFQ